MELHELHSRDLFWDLKISVLLMRKNPKTRLSKTTRSLRMQRRKKSLTIQTPRERRALRGPPSSPPETRSGMFQILPSVDERYGPGY